MNFCRNILHSLGNSPFPGYELKIGELCSLPALSTNDSSARALSIPTGCIPLCVKVEPEFRANSGNGETPNLYIVIYDNNNKYYYYAWRNSSGWVSGGSKTQYLCPIGAYDGDVEAASAIKTIYARAYNGAGWAYSDYKYGKISVTVWLEKNRGGGGSLHYKLFKNPFVKGFSACCKSGKRWNLMGFCRNILPGNAGGNPFPGYKLKTGTLFSGGFQTFTWDKSKIIPLIIHINCSGGGNYYTARRAYFNLNNISKTILYLEDIDPGSCRGSTESDICTLSFATLEQLQNIDSCSFTQSGGGNGFSLTAQCTMWLEKVGA